MALSPALEALVESLLAAGFLGQFDLEADQSVVFPGTIVANRLEAVNWGIGGGGGSGGTASGDISGTYPGPITVEKASSGSPFTVTGPIVGSSILTVTGTATASAFFANGPVWATNQTVGPYQGNTLRMIPNSGGLGEAPVLNFRRVDLSNSSVNIGFYVAGEMGITGVSTGGLRLDGPVILPGDPTNGFHAATKAYVDAHAGGVGGAASGDISGTYPGPMTVVKANGSFAVAADLTLNAGTALFNNSGGAKGRVNATGTNFNFSHNASGTVGDDATKSRWNFQLDTLNDRAYFNRAPAAGVFGPPVLTVWGNGRVSVTVDPTSALDLATKQYVDAHTGAGFDASLVNDVTWGNATDTSMLWTFRPTGSNNPSLTFGNESISINSGASASPSSSIGLLAASVNVVGVMTGGAVTLLVQNSGTGNAVARHTLNASGTGDAYTDYYAGFQDWSLGVDQSDSQAFVISKGAGLFTSNSVFRASVGGGVSFPNAVGVTVAGPLAVAADPSTALQVATKQYVDAHGFVDAPVDSQVYGRKNAAWFPTGGGILEAPTDGQIYGRRNATWVAAGGSSYWTAMPSYNYLTPDTTTTAANCGLLLADVPGGTFGLRFKHSTLDPNTRMTGVGGDDNYLYLRGGDLGISFKAKDDGTTLATLSATGFLNCKGLVSTIATAGFSQNILALGTGSSPVFLRVGSLTAGNFQFYSNASLTNIKDDASLPSLAWVYDAPAREFGFYGAPAGPSTAAWVQMMALNATGCTIPNGILAVTGDANAAIALLGSITAKTRLVSYNAGASPGAGLYFNRSPIGNAQDDAAKPSWGIQLPSGSDGFLVQRSPAGSTTQANLLALDNAGNLSLGGPITTLLQTSQGGPQCGLYLNNAVAPPDGTKCSLTMIMDGAVAPNPGWYFYFRTLGGASGLGTQVANITSGGTFIISGAVGQKSSGTTWSNPSDRRLKDDITDYTTGLATLLGLQPRTFRYNGRGGSEAGMQGYGFLADEVSMVMPEMVGSTWVKLDPEDDHLTEIQTVDQSNLILALLNATKELAARVTALEAP